MRQISRAGCALFVAVAFFWGPVQADTIVLKNGRRIVAFNVREEGEKVKYETSAGELSLPKSIVDHIEKNGTGPPGNSPAEAAANLAITPPAMEATSGGTEIESGAVHDGAVDKEYIAKLEEALASSNPFRGQNCALGIAPPRVGLVTQENEERNADSHDRRRATRSPRAALP